MGEKINYNIRPRSNLRSKIHVINYASKIMGIDGSENSSKTLDFLIFCDDDGSADITQEDGVTETTSNDTKQGRLQQQ